MNQPGALIGFAGPRVIENTIRQKLPEGFQTAEFLLDHGMVDRITGRLAMKAEIGMILSHLGPKAPPRVEAAVPPPRKSQRKLDGRHR